ncbi:hypothetical protein ACFX10_036649 [Malus domestica]
MASALASVAIPQQKLYDGVQFPVVISPTPTPAAAAIPSLTKTIQAGAFPYAASDFNDVVQAFVFEEQPYNLELLLEPES